MSLFSWFSSGPEAAEKVLNASISGLDKLVFTDEERADLNKKIGDQWIEMNRALNEESTTRSVTRRVIAFAVIFPFVLLMLISAAVFPWIPEYSEFLVRMADTKFGWLVVGIGGFYFGPHMIGRMGKKRD